MTTKITIKTNSAKEMNSLEKELFQLIMEKHRENKSAKECDIPIKELRNDGNTSEAIERAAGTILQNATVTKQELKENGETKSYDILPYITSISLNTDKGDIHVVWNSETPFEKI